MVGNEEQLFVYAFLPLSNGSANCDYYDLKKYCFSILEFLLNIQIQLDLILN